MKVFDIPTAALQSPLTIVHVVLSSHIAGGERHCIDLAQAQAALGHQVHVIGTAGSTVEGALGPSVRFHGLALPLLRGLRVQRLVARLRADICHGHLGPACKATAHVRSATRIGTLHVGFKAHHHGSLDGLICVNQAQRSSLPALDASHCVIYNWAPEKPAAVRADLRAELGLGDEQLLVGSVGRLHPSKGMDLLISAFKSHAPANAVLAILGEGKDLPKLQRLADGDRRIHFLGFRSDVDATLPGMDLFVSPSREEAFPLAMLEAQRAGLPILATATQGANEMLAGQPGELVAVDDVAGLGAGLARKLAELGALPRMARAKPAYDLSGYERSNAVARVIAFYRDVMASRRRAAVSPEHRVSHA